MDKLPRNRNCGVVWEVGVLLWGLAFVGSLAARQVTLQTGAGDAKIVASKPKLFLTATVVLPPQTWVKVA